ncbi:MAG TPA: hypothetical protein PKJ34_13340 [Anaerolineaceae bacterium]|nr:hypothetical protein [Anaerolineaceae bacterium]HOH21340.1 hypothetical protein [Anaerolineaceae bacterium]HPA33878.1 hypothetical protein [Anaerolineaceae bacterium]HQO98628.1 hypothetical protein [Anaerolineaceae bacterium]
MKDVNLPETREAQAEVAPNSGVSIKASRSMQGIDHDGEPAPGKSVGNDGAAAVKDASEDLDLNQLKENYHQDLLDRSGYPNTIDKNAGFDKEWEKLSPDETAEKRTEYRNEYKNLMSAWEEKHGMPWPTYQEDVHSPGGDVIKKAGNPYDMHHIHPLGMGGENQVKNITPMHTLEHTDSWGIHKPDSPYRQIDAKLGGED